MQSGNLGFYTWRIPHLVCRELSGHCVRYIEFRLELTLRYSSNLSLTLWQKRAAQVVWLSFSIQRPMHPLTDSVAFIHARWFRADPAFTFSLQLLHPNSLDLILFGSSTYLWLYVTLYFNGVFIRLSWYLYKYGMTYEILCMLMTTIIKCH